MRKDERQLTPPEWSILQSLNQYNAVLQSKSGDFSIFSC